MTGTVFAVVFAIGFLAGGETPDTDASGEEVITHYSDDGKIFLTVLALMLAAVLFMFFAGALRHALRDANGEEGWLPTVVFGGGVAYAIGLAIFATGQIMLIDAADLGRPEVAQALNIFDNDNFFPTVIGLATLLLATGLQTFRSTALPRWLGWVSLVLGILAVAGPAGFIAFLLFPLWVLVVSIVLFRRDADLAASQPEAAAT